MREGSTMGTDQSDPGPTRKPAGQEPVFDLFAGERAADSGTEGVAENVFMPGDAEADGIAAGRAVHQDGDAPPETDPLRSDAEGMVDTVSQPNDNSLPADGDTGETQPTGQDTPVADTSQQLVQDEYKHLQNQIDFQKGMDASWDALDHNF
jgi:hypothetical protein